MRYYTVRNRQFLLKEEDKDKYIVVACARQEEQYIIEWVEHYLNLGFDKFFIGDNNDEGDDSLNIVLKDFVDNGIVEIFDIRGEEKIQIEFYNMFSQIGNYKWCAYFDCDEFLELNAYDNIKLFLQNSHLNDKFVEFNWVMYSNNGEITKRDGKVQERFKHPLPLIFTDNFYKKTIVNGDYQCEYAIHGVSGEELMWEKPIGYKEGYIKHYKYKSIEEQFIAINRGDVALGRNYNNCSCLSFNFDEEYFKLLKYLEENKRLHDNYYPLNDDCKVIIFNINEAYLPNVFRRIQLYMLNYSDKIFYINSKKDFPEYWFNILFEYALHTNNKISLQYPCLNAGFMWQEFNLLGD